MIEEAIRDGMFMFMHLIQIPNTKTMNYQTWRFYFIYHIKPKGLLTVEVHTVYPIQKKFSR